MRRILVEQRIVARHQNKVFVELASQRLLSAADARQKYGIGKGKGTAYVEFEIEDALLLRRYNPNTRCDERYIVGDVELAGRAAEGRLNI